jgi:hypothetical protein
MKTMTIIAALTMLATSAMATTTNCFWIGTTYTCTTYGSGGMSTTRCTTIGTTVRCTTY